VSQAGLPAEASESTGSASIPRMRRSDPG
jgi:hypothetical protein